MKAILFLTALLLLPIRVGAQTVKIDNTYDWNATHTILVHNLGTGDTYRIKPQNFIDTLFEIVAQKPETVFVDRQSSCATRAEIQHLIDSTVQAKVDSAVAALGHWMPDIYRCSDDGLHFKTCTTWVFVRPEE